MKNGTNDITHVEEVLIGTSIVEVLKNKDN